MSDHRTLTRNITRAFREASPESLDLGLDWYDRAAGLCERIGAEAGYGLTHSVVALAHLSPRIRWAQNLAYLDSLLQGQDKPLACLSSAWGRAKACLTNLDPLSTFGSSAYKTRAFAAALLGDRNAIVLDTWAIKVAGAEEVVVRRASGYVAIAEAYRRAGKRLGYSGRDVQAVTWVHVRGAAA